MVPLRGWRLSGQVCDCSEFGGILELQQLNPGGEMRVLRADPQIRIAAEFVSELRTGSGATVELQPNRVRLDGDLLRITGDDQQTVIYRIDREPCVCGYAYRAVWPD